MAVICCSCKLPIFSGLNLKMCVIFAACAVVLCLQFFRSFFHSFFFRSLRRFQPASVASLYAWELTTVKLRYYYDGGVSSEFLNSGYF